MKGKYARYRVEGERNQCVGGFLVGPKKVTNSNLAHVLEPFMVSNVKIAGFNLRYGEVDFLASYIWDGSCCYLGNYRRGKK